MRVTGEVFIDANIPMYSDGRPGPYKEPCIRALDMIANEEIYGVSSVEVLQEILHRYRSIQMDEKGFQIASDFAITVHEVLPVYLEDVQIAMALMKSYRGIPTRDLIHVAVMLNNGIYTIISADKHFDLFPEIHRIDPIDFHRS